MEPLEIGRNKNTIHNSPIIPKRRPVISNRSILRTHRNWNEKQKYIYIYKEGKKQRKLALRTFYPREAHGRDQEGQDPSWYMHR